MIKLNIIKFFTLILVLNPVISQSQVETPYLQEFENENFFIEDYGNMVLQVATANDSFGTSNINYPDPNVQNYREAYILKVDSAKSYSWTISNKHQSNGNSLKLTVHKDDHPAEALFPRSRSEISYVTNNDKGYYYTWKVFIPTDEEFQEIIRTNSYHTLMQLKPHRTGNNFIGTDINGNPVDIAATIGALYYEYSKENNNVKRNLNFWIDDPYYYKQYKLGQITYTTYKQKRKRLFISDAFQKGIWNEIILKVNWNTDENKGYTQFWINRKPVVRNSIGNPLYNENYASLHDAGEEPFKMYSGNITTTADISPIKVLSSIKLGHYREFQEEIQSMYIDDFRITEEMPPIENQTKLTFKSCGATLTANNSKISCYPISNTTNYKFRFTNSNGIQKWIDSSSPIIDLSNFYNDDYFLPNTVYNVQVRGNGDYSDICTIRTPYKTRLLDVFCNATIEFNSILNCYAIPNTTNYKFKFTNSNGVKKWIDSSTPSIKIIDPYFEIGGSYQVEVRSDNQAYGQVCNITILNIYQKNDLLIKESKSISTLSAYPNPFNTQIKLLNNKQIKKIQVFDITGKLHFENNLQDNLVDLSFLDNGIYILKVYSNDNEFDNYKIIKEE